MIQPEPESAFCVDAMDAREKFLRWNCAVEGFAWREAIIAAVTGWVRVFFTKISQQRRAPAFACLSVMNHLLKLCPGDSPFAFALFVDEMELLCDIARAEKQH